MIETFAMGFRRARRSARDRERGGSLTQERFAELLAEEPGAIGTTTATISNWERGRSQPHRYDRRTLRAIVTVLMRCKGLASLHEANRLLSCGGYAPLSQEELDSGSVLPTHSDTDMAVVSDTTIAARSNAEHSSSHTLIAIRHQSMELIPVNALRTSLPEELQACEYIELLIDQCDLFQNGRLIDPHEAARRQRDLEERVAALLDQHPDAQLAYYAIAHIPLLFLAGYTLSNRRAMLLFENDRYTRTWDLLQHASEAPLLKVAGWPEQIERGVGEVALRVSISYRVTAEVVAEVIPKPLAQLELGLERPQLDAITSDEQLRSYAQAFRQTMDRIHEHLPRATGIHIFYAGPPSLAFLCGQLVSKTIHPQLVIYNFVGKDRPQYGWGLDLTQSIDAPTFVVRPGVSLHGGTPTGHAGTPAR